MNLKRRVIESTIVAVMLTLVIAVTTVISSDSTVNAADKEEIQTAAVAADTDGVAGIIDELSKTGREAAELASVSVEKMDINSVSEAVQQKPQLTEEQQAWSNKLMANVEEYLYIRSAADAESEVAGKLYKGAAGDIVETLDGWYHITSGSVDGYVKSELCMTGQDALNYAEANCETVATASTGGLRVRSEASEEAAVLKAVYESEKLTVDTQASAVDGWIAVTLGNTTGYVSAEYVTVERNVGTAVSIEEEKAALAKKAAEEEAKKAAQTTKTMLTQNASVSASVDDATLLASIIYCEAGSECYEGQLAVGAVVMNRVRSGSFPSGISDVIYQRGQFTPAGSGKLASAIASGAGGSCMQAAQEALSGVDNTGGALSFRRASSGQAGLVIGNHVFY